MITSGYPLSTVPGNLNYFSLIPITLIITIKLGSRGKLWPKNFASYAFFLLLFLTLTSFITNLNVNNLSLNIKFLLVISFSYMFCLFVSFNDFIKFYLKTLKVISIISLIGYSILNYTSLTIPLGTFKNINDVEYYNGIVFFAIKSFSEYGNDGFERNIGAFWEPGLFATTLLIAIVFELWKNKINKVNIIIFLIALYTTKSTFGYIMVLPIVAIIMSKKIKTKRNIIILNTFFIGILTFSVNYLNDILVHLSSLNPILFSKLVTESASVNERIESPLINLEIFKNNILFGAGIGNIENLFISLTESSQTSTSTYFLATFGILGISYTLFFIYGILSFKKVNLTSRLMFLIIILTQINKEPHMYFTLTFILMFYFLKMSSTKSYNFEK
ncbi:hypothetical protein [Arenibacter amylolyticus]|uniref:hypothetical protein n=1 Tax=Arenibacter amylolyticus TaxID=1406873 RepID=UPI00111FBD3C|nr:hypothetical protein [Arenibacter amylolyticus]